MCVELIRGEWGAVFIFCQEGTPNTLGGRNGCILGGGGLGGESIASSHLSTNQCSVLSFSTDMCSSFAGRISSKYTFPNTLCLSSYRIRASARNDRRSLGGAYACLINRDGILPLRSNGRLFEVDSCFHSGTGGFIVSCSRRLHTSHTAPKACAPPVSFAVAIWTNTSASSTSSVGQILKKRRTVLVSVSERSWRMAVISSSEAGLEQLALCSLGMWRGDSTRRLLRPARACHKLLQHGCQRTSRLSRR